MANDAPSATLTYRYRLYPTRAQHRRLREAVEHCRALYNAALEERIGCYRKTGKGRSYFDQTRALTQYRQECGSPFSWMMEAEALKRVDTAYQAFFSRGGFPRFQSLGRYQSIGWNRMDGVRIRDGRLIAKGIGAMVMRMHRPMPSEPKTVRIKSEGRHWYACFTVSVLIEPTNNKPAVGIDLGVSALAALSNGEIVPNPRPYLRSQKELRRRSKALARCARGGKNRSKARARLATVHRKVKNSRDTYLHSVSADLVRRFGVIAIEDLNVKGLAASTLAKSVNDAAWGKLTFMLRYKAECAGGRVVAVDCRGTSQTCPECGSIKRKALSERTHRCDCGCVMDRDVAAAKVVLHRAVHGPAGAKVGGCAVPSPRKAVVSNHAQLDRSNRKRVGEDRPVWPLTPADLPVSYQRRAS